MKDQNQIPDGETKQDKWNRGLDIFIESVIKPDPALRQCAHNQLCYHELMDVRQDVLEYLKTKRWNLLNLKIHSISLTPLTIFMTVITTKSSVILVKQSPWITGRMLEWCGGIKRHSYHMWKSLHLKRNQKDLDEPHLTRN